CPCAAALTASAAAQGSELSLQVAVERTSGDYGGTEDVDDTYVPLVLSYDRRRMSLRLTVPYLKVEFLDAAAIDGAEPVTYAESGLGDVIAGVTVYDVAEWGNGSVVMDFTGKEKIPTADEGRGLGT